MPDNFFVVVYVKLCMLSKKCGLCHENLNPFGFRERKENDYVILIEDTTMKRRKI